MRNDKFGALPSGNGTGRQGVVVKKRCRKMALMYSKT